MQTGAQVFGCLIPAPPGLRPETLRQAQGRLWGEPEFDRVTTHQGHVLVPLLAVIG
jgi:hypothetical protein